jgi:ketosteroid isomerase-like protein
MKSILRFWRGILFTVTSFLLAVLLSGRARAGEDVSPASCSSPPHHQFDFWAGDWDVFDMGSPVKIAYARIDLILKGCVLREDYQDTSGQEGQSFTIYDGTKNVWHQTWVTSRGVLLEIEGGFNNGEMVLSGKDQKGDIVRGTWRSVDGGVRETAVKSPDAGKNWEPWFDIVFRPKSDPRNKITTGIGRDEKEVVAALDTQYQNAVKENDAGTMDKILANDFILVTSSGKIYTKAELLDEAKSGRTTYEHQEDTDKTVRIWGDTAIVTAQLWEKGTQDGKAFERRLWFSDVYRRTPSGWRYVFAQSAYRPSEAIR